MKQVGNYLASQHTRKKRKETIMVQGTSPPTGTIEQLLEGTDPADTYSERLYDAIMAREQALAQIEAAVDGLQTADSDIQELTRRLSVIADEVKDFTQELGSAKKD